ncbi:low specificity L-threonine aldolase [Rhodobacter sp. KR11]|uniref:threonine aldolase family protein n=1 Tax=Rhodobacter sp. KR11 TaxID=2974588 RepID=UPI0022219C2D|nr:low specificity L-threonine aldolase [Rhodobacter sp. KR11]MCW1918695.1 low specificity L-threonine aldolase [Rhodobacter sp. KR11]
MFFASDNTSGVAPQIMAAMTRANAGYAKSYGADDIMARVRTRIREVFEAPDAEVHLVATGTAANALSLALIAPPWSAIFAHEAAHIAVDECGAPEFYTAGAKLIPVPGAHGKITPETLSAALAQVGASGVHGVQRGCLSLTNVTEAGTVYTPAEIATLTALAHRQGLPCHLDGARFANALVATGATPAQMTWQAGIDVLSFGGTKNGCMGVEAVVLFDPARAWELELRRKRAGHLFSKHRFLSAQFEAYLDGDLWLTLARHANAMGQNLAQGLARVPGASLMHPAPANMLFPWLAPGTNARAAARGAQYYAMQDGPRESARFVSSWSTTPADVEALIAALVP